MLVDFHSMFFLDGVYLKFAIRSERTTSVEVEPNQRNVDYKEVGYALISSSENLKPLKTLKFISECWDCSV